MGKSARDVMTPNPKSVRETSNLQEVARMMRDVDAGVIPVCNVSNKIVGLVTDRDIVVRAVADGRNPAEMDVAQVMSKDIHCVRESDSIDRVFEMMSQHQIRRVPVVNDQDELVGIVAQADVATKTNKDKRVGQTVEEISERA